MNSTAAMYRRTIGEEKFAARLAALDWRIACARTHFRLHSKAMGNAGPWLGRLSSLRRQRRDLLGEAPERHTPDFETTVSEALEKLTQAMGGEE